MGRAVLLLLAVAVAGCCLPLPTGAAPSPAIAAPRPGPVPPPPFDCSVVLCSLSYDPVCAPDGYSYVNECIARCSDKVNLNGPFKKGLCSRDPSCICPAIFAPVCDASGKNTWSNTCNADCARAPRPFKQGACDPCAGTPTTYAPVCGKDGKTYHNRQLLKCSSAALAYNGPCRICPKVPKCLNEVISPVCGADRKTYCNACTAASRNVAVASKGFCKTGTCLPTGSPCLTANPKCCKGLTCWTGPVAMEGKVQGTCRGEPLPIG